LSNRQVNNLKHHQSTLSTSSSKQNRGGFFTLAALARDKTSNAIASFSEPSIRSRPSSGSLYRSAQSSPTSPSHHSNSNSHRSADSQASSQDNTSSPSSNNSSPSFRTRSENINSSTVRNSLLETDPPSQAYANTASDTPAPIVLPRSDNSNKMHQTSSRLLRMTSDDRPFTRVRIIYQTARVKERGRTNSRQGLQRSICNVSCELAISTPPRPIEPGRSFILVRRSNK
jgi:hypothetical protein